MKESNFPARPILVLMTVLMVALLGSFMIPLSASADGTGGDPPMEAPTYDSILAEDGSADPAAPSGDGLTYELMTLIVLM